MSGRCQAGGGGVVGIRPAGKNAGKSLQPTFPRGIFLTSPGKATVRTNPPRHPAGTVNTMLTTWRRWRDPLKNRPHGTAVLGALAGAAGVLALLAAGVIYQPLLPYAFAAALGYALVLLALLVVLVVTLRAAVNDVGYSVSLDGGLRRAGYEPRDFFTDAAAANPSFQLLNLKVLSFCRPERVLELGSGQTTKLLSCYHRQNPSAYVLTLEQDAGWVRQLAPHVGHDYRHVEVEPKEFVCAGTGLRLSTKWYKDVPELRQHKFNFILVDGPDHGGPGTDFVPYSRCGILEHMPAILAPSFVVIFDDAERHGELLTIDALDAILRAAGVPFVRFTRNGIKTQCVFCSKDYQFLRSV
jgi:hypothetical protein